MEFTKQITVNAPANTVWEIVGTNFNEISEWASPVLTSRANPDLEPGQNGRVCQVKGAGQLVETITRYDDQGRKLSFTVEGEKMPFFMKHVENTWSVRPQGHEQSVVQVNANITLSPLFNLLSGPLSKALGKQGEAILSDLKQFAETEKVHA